GTSITVSIATSGQIEWQRAALTGFAVAAANSNATTSAEPIVTFSASSNMSNERVLSAGQNTTVNTATAGQIRIDVPDPVTPTWAEVLAAGATSGGTSPVISSGDHLTVPGGQGSTGDIRSAADLAIVATTTARFTGDDVVLWSQDDFFLATGAGGDIRLAISDAGAWSLAGTDAGTSGEVLTSQGSAAPPIWQAVDLSSVTYTAGTNLTLASNQFSWDGANIYNATATFQKVARDLAVGSTTSIIGAYQDAGGNGAWFRYERAALTGFAVAAANSNATTSAEPIVTFSASSNMSNERVLSPGTNTTVSTAVAGEISVGVDDLPIGALADIADDTFLGNVSGATAAPVAVSLATLSSGTVSYNTATNQFRVVQSAGYAWTGTGHSWDVTNFDVLADNVSIESDNDMFVYVSAGLSISTHTTAVTDVDPLDILINAFGGVGITANQAAPMTGLTNGLIHLQGVHTLVEAGGGVSVYAGTTASEPTFGIIALDAATSVTVDAPAFTATTTGDATIAAGDD